MQTKHDGPHAANEGGSLVSADMKTSLSIVLAALLLLASGCSGSRSPKPSLEVARLAIQEAARYEAGQYAASELSVAEEKLRLAETAAAEDNYEHARRLAEQATVDAQFAQTRALAQRAQIAAVETRDTVQTLREVR